MLITASADVINSEKNDLDFSAANAKPSIMVDNLFPDSLSVRFVGCDRMFPILLVPAFLR